MEDKIREMGTERSEEDLRIIRLANLLKAVAHPARLCIVKKLYLNGACNVGYFTNCMGISQSGVSQHLAKLRDLGIVGVKKQGLESYYSLVDEDIKKIVEIFFMEDRNE
ncbi:MAG: metalloregulator ArsR/SmtB family transcription factor [Peptostreptococcaceae bacterium]|nr:metalloregulator ArsR/SmtB family transcription factor [Peptostreptococcaceae bacterium]